MTECVNAGECQGLSVCTGVAWQAGVRRRHPETLPSTWLSPVQEEADRSDVLRSYSNSVVRQCKLIIRQSANTVIKKTNNAGWCLKIITSGGLRSLNIDIPHSVAL